MTSHQLISSGSKWEPIIGYSRAVRVGNVVHVSGTSGPNVDGSFAADPYTQAHRALSIIAEALQSAGASPQDVVRTRIYVTQMDQWQEICRAHGEVFGEVRPATAIVEVSKLIDPQMLVEIEAEAIVS
jgi:enamine deaminase RidA (YjgF/YER057c/UK114 family)